MKLLSGLGNQAGKRPNHQATEHSFSDKQGRYGQNNKRYKEIAEPKRLCQAAVTACTGSLAGGRIPVAHILTNPQPILPTPHPIIYPVKSS